MKRFFLFAFDQDYPKGGMDDKRGEFDTLEKAIQEGRTGVTEGRQYWDFWQVLDTDTGGVTGSDIV